MTRSTSAQVKARRECYEAHKYTECVTGKVFLICHICGGMIDPVREPWEADHLVAVTFEGSNSPSNLRPAHVKCHRIKTSTQDVPANARCKRLKDKHLGIKSRGWNTKYRKKLNGEVVLKTGRK